GNTYEHLFLNPEIEKDCKKFLEENYYQLLSEEYFREKIQENISSFTTEAIEFWEKVVEFDAIEYALSGYGKENYKLVNLGRELSRNEIGYLIDYWTSSWSEYQKEFIFRTAPVDTRQYSLNSLKKK
ncbi:MAG: hypothetical protein ACOC1X_03360, partial [Promethearchaeota archaeon]